MDELPPHAKELLRLARDLDDCRDHGARERVRERVAQAAAVGTSANRHGLQNREPAIAPRSTSVGLVGKLALGIGVLALAGGGALLRTTSDERADEAEVARASPTYVVAQPASPAAPAAAGEGRQVHEARAPEVAPIGAPSVVHELPLAHRRPRDTLDLEVRLLQKVSDALTRGDTQRARRLLDQHHARFPTPTLLEERSGFQAMLRCLEREPKASAHARTFTRRYPNSVLGLRVARACEATGEEP